MENGVLLTATRERYIREKIKERRSLYYSIDEENLDTTFVLEGKRA